MFQRIRSLNGKLLLLIMPAMVLAVAAYALLVAAWRAGRAGGSTALAEQFVTELLAVLPLGVVLLAVTMLVVMFAWRAWMLEPVNRLLHSLEQNEQHGVRVPVNWAASDEVGTLVARYNAALASQARHAGSPHAQMFRDIFSEHAAVMYVVDMDTLGLVDCNRAAERFYGMTREALLRSRFTDLNILSEERVRDLIQDVRSTREVRFELRHRRNDGFLHHLEVHLSPILNEDGDGVFFVLVQDVTDRRQADLALKEQTRLLAQAEHIGRMGHWYYRQRDGHLSWSDEIYRIYGLSPTEHAPTLESAIEVIHPDDRGLAARALRSAISERRPFGFELRLLKPDGTMRHVWSQGHLDFADDGEFRGVLGVIIDITQRKRLEQELLEREMIWRQGAALARIGAFVWDHTLDRCTFCSEELAQIHGLSVAEFMQRYRTEEALLEAVHSGDRERVRQTLARTAHRGQPYQVEYRVASTRGAVRFVIQSATPLAHPSGHVVSVGSVQDISDRKRLENQLRERAVFDGLTGAFNRRHFMELGEREFRRARRYRRPLTLLMLDLDHFKRINDQFGHAVGDEALRRVSETCRRALRAQDLFGRLGGEEFAILLPETRGVDAVDIAERLRAGIEALELSAGETPVPVTASIGSALYRRDDVSLESLIKRADGALYEAKSVGRNKVVFSD